MPASTDTPRREIEIRTDLAEITRSRQRREEALAETQAQQQNARARLAELDQQETQVFLGEIDRNEHGAARVEAERLLAEAQRAELALRESVPAGLDDRQAALEKELRECELGAACDLLPAAVDARNEAAVEFAAHLQRAYVTALELEVARDEVDSIIAEVRRLGGEERLLVLAGEPEWGLPVDHEAAAWRLNAIVSRGPAAAIETAEERADRLEAQRVRAEDAAAAKRESLILDCLHSRRSLEMCPPHIRDEVAARREKIAAERAAAQPAEPELDLAGTGLTLGPGDRAA
jgi:hypothetical protein